MEHDQTERVIEETGVGDPLAEREPEEPAKPAGDIEPEDATPEEGVERPETEAPDPDHVVEENRRTTDVTASPKKPHFSATSRQTPPGAADPLRTLDRLVIEGS
jgi:hypothetical protein